MSPPLTGADRAKLVKVLALLSSSHDGERAAAGFMASRMLRERGLDWDSLIAPAMLALPRQPDIGRASRPPTCPASSWSGEIRFLLRHLDRLNGWEVSFLRSTSTRSRLTAKQGEVLVRLYDRLIGEGLR